jgi:protocatechuate 3,4-dioxygenase beta subunit
MMGPDSFSAFVDQVVGAMTPGAPGSDPRLQAKMRIALRRLHELIRELELNEDELAILLDFVRKVGRADEWSVLTHLLGVDMHVKDLSHGGFDRRTIDNVEGPLYKLEAPLLGNPAKLADNSEPGDRLFLSGAVRDVASGEPVAGALIDVWQSDSTGAYSQDDPNLAEWALRGRLRTDGAGKYSIETIIPGGYEQGLVKDSPCGDMLIKLGRHRMRPAHIHFKVAAEGFRSLITLTYFSGDPYLDTDSVFSVRPQLVLDLRKHDSPAEIQAAHLSAPFFSAKFDFVLDRLNLDVGKDREPVHELARQ